MSNVSFDEAANGTYRVKEVDAYYVAEGELWLVRCPFCGLVHFHGAKDGSSQWAGQRTSHCPPGVSKSDYYLIRVGSMTVAQAAKWERRSNAALPRLLKRLEAEKAQQKVRNR